MREASGTLVFKAGKSAGDKVKILKCLLLTLTNNQKIQIKIRYHCSTNRWFRFLRLIIFSVGKGRGKDSTHIFLVVMSWYQL